MKIVEHRIEKGKTITTYLCIGITKEQGLRIINMAILFVQFIYDS